MGLENKHTPSCRLFFILSYAAYVFCLFVFKFSTLRWFTLIWNAQMEDCLGCPPRLSYLKSLDRVWLKQLGLQSNMWLNRISLKNNVSDIEIREKHKTKPTQTMICGGKTSKDPGPLPHLPIRHPNHKLLWWRGREKKGVKYSAISMFHFRWLLQFKNGIMFNILIRDSHVQQFFVFRFYFNEHLVIYSGSKLQSIYLQWQVNKTVEGSSFSITRYSLPAFTTEWKAGQQVKECVQQLRVDAVTFEICHSQASPLKDPV